MEWKKQKDWKQNYDNPPLSPKRIIAVIAAIVVIAAGCLMDSPFADLPLEGFRALCILVAAIILWVTEAIPVIITSLALLPAFTYMGVMTPQEFFAASSSTAVFFTLAGFGIGAALLNTNLARLLMGAILRRAKGDSAKIVQGFFLLTVIVSIIVANYAAIIAVLGLAAAAVKAFGDPKPGTSGLAKGIMLSVPFGSMCGGIATPASNSLNVTLMDLLAANTGIEMGFLQWCAMGIPMCLILTLFGLWWLPRAVKPEKLTEEQIQNLESVYTDGGTQLGAQDWKFLIIVVAMAVLWLASNWIRALDTTRVALLGVLIMFLPGIDLLDGKQYMKNCAPMGVIMLLCIMPIVTAMNKSGAGAWIANNLFAGAAGWPKVVMLLMVTLAAMIIHLAVPSGNSNAALCGTLIFATAVGAGIPGAAVALIFACQCGNNFLVAYEGIYAFTYGYGHYSFGDVFRSGLPFCIVQYVLCVAAAPLLAMLFQFA